MQNYSCRVKFDNETSYHLKLLKSDATTGEFTIGPIPDIPPEQEMQAFMANGKFGPEGTEGYVVYQIGDDANKTITINFNIPTNPLASNTITVDVSDRKFAAMMQDFVGSGASESVTLRIVGG